MAPERVDIALIDFKKELGLSNDAFDKLLDNDVDSYISLIASIDGEEYPILKEFATVFVSTIIRLVDKEVMLNRVEKGSIGTAPYTASIRLKGDLADTLIFSAGEPSNAKDFAGKFAEGYMGVSIEADEEMAQGAMKEFLNCIGGLLTTELTSERPLKLDIEVPDFSDTLPVEREVTVLPLSILSGNNIKIFVL
jgi:CheY-specific phosphatase CheX